MKIDYTLRTRTGLAYVQTLLQTQSPYGTERARKLRLYDASSRERLLREWHNVQAAVDGLALHGAAYDRLQRQFMQLRDIRGTLRRAAETALTEVELFEIKRFLLQLEQMAALFDEIGAAYREIRVAALPEALAVLDPERGRAQGFSVSGAYDKALAAVREEKRRVEMLLRKAPHAPEQEALLSRRRLLVAREEAETLRVRERLTQALAPWLAPLWENIRWIGLLDFTIQRAILARARGAARPELSAQGLEMEGMWHPQVADALAERGQSFTAITLRAPEGATVLTGANMGGKSVALKTLALNALLCQAGFFAFAKRAAVPLFDEVFFLGEDAEAHMEGLSSFGAEVVRLQRVLQTVQAGAFCLVVLDEPARGTNPKEGAALAGALVGKLARLHSVAVIATHFDGAAARAQAHYRAAGLSGLPEANLGGDRLAAIAAHMDYGLMRVAPDAPAPQEALSICRLLGLDDEVIAAMQETLRGDIKTQSGL